MTTRPTVKIYDAATDEEIIREMNDDEYDVYLQDVKRFEKRKQEEIAANQKRETAIQKLAALGLTQDDLLALGL